MKTDVPAEITLVEGMKKAVVAWWFGYWTQICQYKPTYVQTLMESFDIDAARLAALSTFDPETLTVSADFADKNNFLEEVEPKYGLGFVDNVDMGKVQIYLATSRAQLVSTLCEDDDLSKAEKSGPSKRTGADGASNGAVIDPLKNTMADAIDGKEKALQEIDLRTELAATKEREEKQKGENKELRGMFEKARTQ